MAKAYIALYYSYREQLAILPDDERGRLVLALLDYAVNGTIPTLEGASNMAFAFIRAQIDRDMAKYDARCEKNRENINKRWHAGDTIEYDGIPSYSKHTKEKEMEKEKEKERESSIGQPSAAARTRSSFQPPTLDEVVDYCRERNNGIDAQRFLDYYTANGWMVGKTKMKDWRAAVRNWERQEEPSPDKPRMKFLN